MLNDASYRKTAKCSYYKNFLATKTIPEFPIERVSPDELDVKKLVHSTGFSKPFVVRSVSDAASSNVVDTGKLGLVLPNRDKDLSYVSDIVGRSTPIKIIEVGQQAEITDQTLGEYADYLRNYKPGYHKVLNMITLEFSATPFNSKVQAPTFVRALDWIDSIWPLNRRARGDYPKVQKYCLAGMAGSYTDFHIDFGGTSVWYHVLKGRKRFYLVPPTTANLQAFEKWTTSSAQADVFFADLLPPGNQCCQFDLEPGETFIIPSGWIHAVYTPVDSLVFGGNFVHSYAMLRQLQIYSIEHRTRVQKAYRFPFFRQINWYFLCTILPVAQEMYGSTQQAEQSKEQPSWLAVLEDSDNDEDCDDLTLICRTLKDPIVLYQLPYLVRTCEIWYAAGEDRQEKNVFASGLEESGCASIAEVFAQWWGLLMAITTRLPKCSTPINSGTDTQEVSALQWGTQEATQAHIEHIRRLPQLDLLDDTVVRPVFGAFEKELAGLLQSIPLPGTGVAADDNGAGCGTVGTDGASATSTQTGSTEPLKLKLSFKKGPPAASIPEVPADAPITEVVETKHEPQPAAPAPAQAPAPAPASAPSLRLTLSTTSTASSTSATATSQGSAPSAAKLKAAEKAPVITAAAESKAVGLKLTMKGPKVPAPLSENVERSASGKKGRYGTRGLKLSAAFLSRAMDVDVGEEEHDEEEGSVSDAAEDASEDASEEGSGNEDDGGDGGRTSSRSSRGTKRPRRDEPDEEPVHVMLGTDDDGSSDDTELLSDAEVGPSSGQKRKRGAQSSAPRARSAPIAAAAGSSGRPQYYVDRLSDAAAARSAGTAGAAGAGVSAVPQVQGVRSSALGGSAAKAKVPANNRLKIMKKLGLKI